jgi:hypothetical protein
MYKTKVYIISIYISHSLHMYNLFLHIAQYEIYN